MRANLQMLFDTKDWTPDQKVQEKKLSKNQIKKEIKLKVFVTVKKSDKWKAFFACLENLKWLNFTKIICNYNFSTSFERFNLFSLPLLNFKTGSCIAYLSPADVPITTFILDRNMSPDQVTIFEHKLLSSILLFTNKGV